MWGSVLRRTIGLAASGLLTLAGMAALAGPAQAARPAAATWQLIDYQQQACYVTTASRTNYYGIWISGSWTHQITIGADELPPGGDYYTFYAPIAPGSSDGVGSLAYVAVVLPAGETAGTYTASMWASDGTTTEAVPITLVVADKCGRY